MSVYPVGLDLTGRRVVVVGGGRVAARRVPALLDAGADLSVVAPVVTPALQALATDGRLRHLARPFHPGDLDGAWYAMAATDDPSVNAAVAAEAQQARIFCVRADRAGGGSVRTPASGHHDGLTVAVLADGDPARAAAVRDGLLEGLRAGRVAVAPQRRRAGVALVGGGPGDPGLITVRGAHLVRQADVVVADHLAPWSLLEALPPGVEVVDATKLPRGRAMAQEDINAVLVDRARAGKFVVRLKGGDPMVFGRGYEELLACAAAGVPCEVVPGVSSALAVPTAAGVPVTHRGLAQEFVVVSGHLPPGHPESRVDWPAIGALHGTVVLLMAMHHLAAITDTLIAHGRKPDLPCVVVRAGTTAAQTVLRSTLGEVAQAADERGVGSPAVVVVGPTAGLALPDPV